MSRQMLVHKPSLQMRLLDVSPEDFQLLDRAYHNIFRPAFPNPDEREELADLKDYLQANHYPEKGKGRPYTDQQYNIVVATHSPHGYERPIGIATANRLTDQDVGIAIANRLTDQDVGISIAFFEYSAIHPSYRNQDVWTALTRERTRIVTEQAARKGTGLVAVFTETEDPTRMTRKEIEELSVDPYARREFLSRVRFDPTDQNDRYKQLDFPYVQLPLRDNSKAVSVLDLLMRVHPKYREEFWAKGVPADVVLKSLSMFFGSFEVDYRYSDHPAFIEMKRHLERLGRVQLIDIKMPNHA